MGVEDGGLSGYEGADDHSDGDSNNDDVQDDLNHDGDDDDGGIEVGDCNGNSDGLGVVNRLHTIVGRCRKQLPRVALPLFLMDVLKDCGCCNYVDFQERMREQNNTNGVLFLKNSPIIRTGRRLGRGGQ
ncbi:unnamed protein product [Calicophoron daubneyi]|uniref:Uncharacterized protein n=1 Tax=Calicophoron daubneyi TaxID=300641 RepID=A0AAV2TYZ0_CALDB